MQGSVAVIQGLSCTVACGILVPGPGIEPVSPAFAGGFLTTGSSGKSLLFLFNSSEIYNFLSHMHQLVSGFSSFVCVCVCVCVCDLAFISLIP